MAKVGRSRRRSRDEFDEDDDRRPARRSGGKSGLFIFLLLLILVAWFLPAIISLLPNRDALLSRFMPINGSMRTSSVSLGWLSPIRASGVELLDKQGVRVLGAQNLVVNKTLGSLIFSQQDLGEIEVTSPEVQLLVRDGGSNVEDLLAPLLNGEPSKETKRFHVHISQGVLRVGDAKRPQRAELRDVTADILSDPAAIRPIAVKVNATAPRGTAAGSIELVLSTERGAGSPLATGEVHGRLSQLPLELVGALAARVVSGLETTGLLTSQLDVAWRPAAAGTGTDATISGDSEVQQLALRSSALGADELRLDSVKLPLRAKISGQRLTIEKLALTTDVGQLALAGETTLSEITAAQWKSVLAKTTCQAGGSLDVARLARLLPSTLRIRSGTEVTSGQIAFSLTSAPDAQGMAWNGRIDTAGLHATRDGRAVAWEKPLLLTVAAHATPTDARLDSAVCEASFLHLDASSVPDGLQGRVRFDLAQLAADAAGIVDLGQLELAGKGDGMLLLHRAPGQYEAKANLAARGVRVRLPDRRPWTEDNLSIEAAGTVEMNKAGGIEKFWLSNFALRTPADSLTATLGQELVNIGGPWPVRVEWQGDVARWLSRLGPWMDVAAWNVTGKGQLSANVTRDKARLTVTNLRGQVQPLHAWGPQLWVDERNVDLQGALVLDLGKSTCDVSQLRVVCGAVNVDAKQAHVQFAGPTGGAFSGAADVQADLSQLARWTRDPRQPAATAVAGQLTARVEARQEQSLTTARLESQITNLTVSEPPQPGGATARTWNEPRMLIAAEARYDRAQDALEIQRGQLTADAVACQLAGRIDKLTTTTNLDLTGKLNYDWEKLAPLWRAYVGPGSELKGRHQQNFFVRGPWPADQAKEGLSSLTGAAGLAWESATVYGLRIGPAQLDAQLASGTATIKPVQIAVSEGSVLLAPTVLLARQPRELSLPKGPLVREVRVTPEVCAEMLKYIAPVVADATQTDGRFSIDLEGARVPLADPAAADVGGRLTVHGLQVRPGPLAAQYLAVGRQLEAFARHQALPTDSPSPSALVSIYDQNVEFRVLGKRVYHRGLQFTAGKVTIRTQGSVGFDESLAIMAEIPVDASWAGNDPTLATLRGQTLKIPVQGTLKNPKLDRRALEQIAGQLVESTARGAVINQLNKQIDKLLPIKR